MALERWIGLISTWTHKQATGSGSSMCHCGWLGHFICLSLDIYGAHHNPNDSHFRGMQQARRVQYASNTFFVKQKITILNTKYFSLI